MKKDSLRILALLFALLMAVTLLASCGKNSGNNNSSAQSGEEVSPEDLPELAETYSEFTKKHSVEITWFEQGWTGPEADKDIVAPEIEKLTNLKLDYEPMTVPTGDDYTQKLNLMMASGEVPEVFFGGIDAYTRTIYEKLGQKGTIWDLSEIIKDYDNLYELVYPELNLYRTENNKNYFLPTQTGRGYENINEPPHGLFIRKDFLDQLDMDYPTTPDEFYEYLKRATTELTVDGEPVKGLLLGENIGGITSLYEMFFPLVGAHETYSLPFDSENGYKLVNYEYSASPEMQEAAKFINKLSREGLFDREILTIKTAQYQEKASSGMYAAMTASWWDMNTFADNAKGEIPDIFWVNPPPIYASEEIRESRNRAWTDWVGCWSTLIVNKSVDEETLRHLLAVMDYLVGQEGQMLVQVGIEGVTYEWEEDGTYTYTDQFIKDTNDLDWNKASAYGVFYYSQLVNNTPAISELQGLPPMLNREDNMLSWENQELYRNAYDKHMEPPLDYYFMPGEIRTEKLSPIVDLKPEFLAKIISAGSEEDAVAAVIEWGETCTSMGMDEIVKESQEIMDKIVSENS